MSRERTSYDALTSMVAATCRERPSRPPEDRPSRPPPLTEEEEELRERTAEFHTLSAHSGERL